MHRPVLNSASDLEPHNMLWPKRHLLVDDVGQGADNKPADIFEPA